MRRIFLFILLISFMGAADMAAQVRKGTIHAVSREDLTNKLPKDVAYWFPDFVEAKVFYHDGRQAHGLLNICMLDNTLRFIDERTGDTLLVSGAESIDRILAGEVLLTQHKGRFLQTLVQYGQIGLAEERIFSFSEPTVDTESGYTLVPPTSTARYGSVQNLDYQRIYEFEADVPWELEIRYVLVRDNKIYLAKRASFEKIFSEKKDFIRTFVKSNDTDFANKQDVVSLFWYCTEN